MTATRVRMAAPRTDSVETPHAVEPTPTALPIPSAVGEHTATPFLRPEAEVMCAETLRASCTTRLSVDRIVLRRMAARGWRFSLHTVEVDAVGSGWVIYEIEAEGRRFHFGCFAQPPTNVERQGRIRDNEFDFFGALIDGPVDIARLRRERDEFLAEPWRGRSDSRVYGWTAANRSNRAFEYVIDCLALGAQPGASTLTQSGGYLIRNAGWYGNGRHGSRAWRSLTPDHPFAFPYTLELLALYLWRLVSFDVVDAAARARSSLAVGLDKAARTYLGVGNASGIGTVAALVRWPAWLSAFTLSRELALAKASTEPSPVGRERAERLAELLARARDDILTQRRSGPYFEDPQTVADALDRLRAAAEHYARDPAASREIYPWLALRERSTQLGSREATEQLNALLIETSPSDDLEPAIPAVMAVRREVTPEMRVSELKRIVGSRYRWALDTDFARHGAPARAWYKSEENGENRRGFRHIDAEPEVETFVDVPGQTHALAEALAEADPVESVGRFLFDHPKLALIVSRVQLAAVLPYSELRVNLLDDAFHPCIGIRYFLALLGLEHPEPASEQWLRGVFFRGAPLLEDLAAGRHNPVPFMAAGW